MSDLSQKDVTGLLTLLNSGHVEKAASAARRLVSRFPNAPTLHLIQGVALATQGKLDPAIHSYRKALKLNPKYIDAWNNLGVTLRKQGKLTEAAESYLTALNFEPNSADIKQNLGTVWEEIGVNLFDEGDFNNAVEYYRKVVALRPDSPLALTNLGVALFRMDKVDEALSCLERAAQNQPERIQSLAHLAVVTRHLGRPYEHILKRILEAPVSDWEDTATKMWAALVRGAPELAFSFVPKGLNVMEWEKLKTLYRRSDLQERIKALPQLSGVFPHQNSRPLLYAGGDGVYARMFAQELISSALSKCPDCDVHFHVMNSGGLRPEELFGAFPKDRLTWTIEDMGPSDKVLYASRRWIRLSQIHRRTERTIVLVDADCIIKGDVFKELPDHFDVVVYGRSEAPWLHQCVMAGFFAARPSGRDFTDFLAAYLLHFEDQGIPKWFDDQLNLVSARAWFQRNVPEMSIVDSPRNIMDWTTIHRPECLIWQLKGPLKHKAVS